MSHKQYIQRCIEIGTFGLGTTAPNPMVGCVIVHNHKIIGEGYTSPYGGSHAEVNAINAVEDKLLLSESTLYVTLEPCSHFGKTPPCSDLIIKYKIPNVVIGTMDTHSKVAGNGIASLQNKNVNITVGVLEDACKMHHKRFFTYHNKQRPYIILKWAQTLDGYVAPIEKIKKEPVWITNEISRQLVHKWRAEEQAILVGNKTVMEDNPSLTVRDWTGNNPIRIIIDSSNKLSKSYAIFDNEAETILITADDITSDENATKQICDNLFRRQINSVIIEGGAQTIQSFIDTNLWDEARVFTGNIKFGNGIKAPEFSGRITSEQLIFEDQLKIFNND